MDSQEERQRKPTDADTTDDDATQDTEGHDARRQFPPPPSFGGDRETAAGRRDLAADSGDEPDTEGHLQFRRRPGEGATAGTGGNPPSPDEPDTEGHLQLRRRPGEGGE